jgi:hypothetical protein
MIRKSYSENYVKYILWKNFIGRVDRVDFVPIKITDEIEDEIFQQAFIYKLDCLEWDKKMVETIKEEEYYVLDFTPYEQHRDVKDFWRIYNNVYPIPYADTTLNIHQLFQNNLDLKEKTLELEKEILELKDFIAERKNK